MEGRLEYTIPDYRKDFGCYHNSASGGTQSTYENLSNVSTGLEQLSTRLAEVQDNQQLLQNILNQSR